jgi:hypothetical protein
MLTHERTLTRTAANHDRADGHVLLMQPPYDLSSSVSQPANAGQMECNKAVEISLHAEPRDKSASIGIGERGAVAEEFRDDRSASRTSPPM